MITDIKQIPENSLGDTVRINALQLCAETELLIRYHDLKEQNNKKWFFNSLSASVNNIINISK